jgi:polyphosphate kinase
MSAAETEAADESPRTLLVEGAEGADGVQCFNRDLSHLAFQERVLAQAMDPRRPLLERLRFLCICSSNLDEFFEVRVAGLRQKVEYGIDRAADDGLAPRQVLAELSGRARTLITEQYRILNEEVLPALREEGVHLLRREEWTEAQRAWAAGYFREQVFPVLTPVALDPAHPFPRVASRSLNFIVEVQGADSFGRDVSLAVVKVPRSLPRVIPLPEELCEGYTGFTLLSALVHAHISAVLPGLEVVGCHQFRVTRDSDIDLDEDDGNLLKAVSGQLSSRRFSHPVRLEVVRSSPEPIVSFLLEMFGLDRADLYRVDGPVNLHRLAALVDRADRPELKFQPFVPQLPAELDEDEDLFAALRRRDHLLHHPYQSFKPVLTLLRQAARDPDVLAIKQTLYRTGKKSPVVQALAEASREGKEVTAVVELRARFDEAENIEKANELDEAGANVTYGVVGHKTHAKMLLIVRREAGELRRYVHLGSGNYHPGTARAYTDVGLLSADPTLAEDVHLAFLQLTGLGRAPRMKRLVMAPTRLYLHLLAAIEFEMAEAAAGRPASIQAKMNSLSDVGIIEALYRASQAGVRIELIVRGICRLRPGVPGLSENITVVSIVGRFLEHSRVYRFHAAGEDRVYLASADWMERNLHNRVETVVPIADAKLKQRLVDEVLEGGLADDVDAWELEPDGRYLRRHPGEGAGTATQETELARWNSV